MVMNSPTNTPGSAYILSPPPPPQYFDARATLVYTSKNKKHFFEIKMVSRDDVSAKSAETRILWQCYKIPYFTDSTFSHNV